MAPLPWLAAAVAAAALPVAVLLGLVWRRRDEPGARPYAAMLAVIVAFDLLYAVTLVVGDPAIHSVVYPAAAMVKLLVTVPWVLFALEYTGRGRYATRRTAAGLLVLPALAVPILLTPAREGLLVRNYAIHREAGVVLSSFENGPVWMALAGFGFVLLGVGLAMLLEFVLWDRRRYALQTALLAVAGLLPALTTAGHVLGVGPVPELDLTPLAYAAVSPLVGYGLVRYDLFEFPPATRRAGHAAAIDDIGDAVLIVDEDRRIVELNERAGELLAHHDGPLVKSPLDEVFGEAVRFDGSDGTITVETVRGHRAFDVTTSPLAGPRGERIGYTLVLHDITDEKQRRQRFEVLNRVLRHDLRNSMNAIMGFTRRLETHTDEDAEWMLERLRRQTTQLVDLGEKASAIDRVTSPSRSRSTVAVADAAEAVAGRLDGDHDEVTVSVHVPDGLRITSDPVLVEEAIRYAGTSLVSHNGASPPRLVIAATPTDGRRPWINLTVTTNGDPVPPPEQAVIERGEETPLDHSHDLDLWLVAWAVETLGGELTFIADGDRPGLSMRLPDLPPADDQT